MIYVLTALWLAVYGFNALILIALHLRRRGPTPPPPPLTHFPTVTVQLPIFNELYVVRRLIDSVAALDYPRDRLEIQVLDDSTDETTTIARAQVAAHRARGVNIRLLHRQHRHGFKAGALRDGLAVAHGEFIAIFDADFQPRPDFLRLILPYFQADPQLGLVQARWGHLNADYSWLTRAQALGIDGHFIIEQAARNRNGLWMNFNGSAGVWRRTCIESAGNWQTDTLAEDLDLSYRAQFAGWRFLFLPDVIAPAEVPPQIHAFKAQQFRWAKGAIQCARKHWRNLLSAPCSPFIKWQGFIHLTNYLAHPLLIILLLTAVPIMNQRHVLLTALAYLSIATIGPPALYTLTLRTLYPDWQRRLFHLPWLMLLGTGIALNNSLAVYEALAGHPSSFKRTPKFRVENASDRWADKPYTLPFSPLAFGELALAAYALGSILLALAWGNLFIVPYLLLYALGFGYVGILTVIHSLKTNLLVRVLEKHHQALKI